MLRKVRFGVCKLMAFLLLHQKGKIKTQFLWVEILREKMFLNSDTISVTETALVSMELNILGKAGSASQLSSSVPSTTVQDSDSLQ